MEYRVEVAAQAAWDIDEVVERIAVQYPRMAERWQAGVIKTIESLSLFPDSYPLAPEADAFSEEIRQAIYGKRRHRYRILFSTCGDVVRVLRILHGSRQSLQPGE